MIWQPILDRTESHAFSGFDHDRHVPAIVGLVFAVEVLATALGACARRFMEGD